MLEYPTTVDMLVNNIDDIFHQRHKYKSEYDDSKKEQIASKVI